MNELPSYAKITLLLLLGIFFGVVVIGAYMYSKRSKIILTPDVYQVDMEIK